MFPWCGPLKSTPLWKDVSPSIGSTLYPYSDVSVYPSSSGFISSTLFEFENERIKRDLNNVVNRVINCDIHNSTKTKASCDKQLENIKAIKKYMGFDNLSIRLMEAITLRVKYPDSSLQELSDVSEEVVGRYISKSGISHCMKDLEVIALSLHNKNNEKN